jgi:hypothetical protein
MSVEQSDARSALSIRGIAYTGGVKARRFVERVW